MNESFAYLLELLAAATELEAALGDDWEDFRDALVSLVARLDTGEDDASLCADIEALLEDLSESGAASLVTRVREQAPKDQARGTSRPDSTILATDTATSLRGRLWKGKLLPLLGQTTVPVFFATDREERVGASVEKRFSGERGEMTWGIAQVEIPATHEKGHLETPQWWHFEIRPDPKKHVVISDISTMSYDDYRSRMREALAAASRKDLLIFVHGYNVSFARALKQTAQLSHDLEFDGRCALYSWPSKAALLGYAADEATVEWSGPHFRYFLAATLQDSGAEAVHVIAHSMGNRALARALEAFDPTALPVGCAQLRQIIFAAPDIDAAVFEQLARAFHSSDPPGRRTLYASQYDLPLQLSRLLHRFPRAGDVGDGLLVVDKVDTIDMSRVDTSLFGLGHSYFSEQRSVLADIFVLLTEAKPPDERFGLLRSLCPRGRYWSYLS